MSRTLLVGNLMANCLSILKKVGKCALAGVLIQLPLKGCKQDIPVVDHVQPQVEVVDSHSTPKNILVIDDFKHSNVDVDIDCIGDVSHGFVTSGIIEHGLDNANVYRKCNEKQNSEEKIKSPVVRLDSILSNINKDSIKYDAINMSMSRPRNIEEFGKNIGVNLTAENIVAYKQNIRDFLKKSDNKDDREVASVLDKMDSLIANGTKIYVAAGNEGKKSFNLLNLADGSINVGALNAKGEKARYSCDNSLVNRWENGLVPIKATNDGFNVFGGTQTDVKKNQTTTRTGIPSVYDNRGTSFSTPRAIVKDLSL